MENDPVATLLNRVFYRIRSAPGSALPDSRPANGMRLGGIWHRDSWCDPETGAVAVPEDDGYTVGVVTPEVEARQTDVRPVSFRRGDEAALRALAARLGVA